ncbi:hypothetical protein D3C84_886560 [compost metagenome]
MTQAQGAQLPVAHLGGHFTGLGQFVQQVSGARQERLASGGQSRLARRAFEQRGLQAGCHVLDLPAQC